jgi:hypothetical protein
VHGTRVYFAWVDPNDPTLDKFPDLKKKKKKKMEQIYIWYQIYNFYFLRKKKEMRFANMAFVPRWTNVAYMPH